MRTRLIAVLVVVAGLVAACSSGEGTGGQLDGTKWILRSYLVDSTLTLVPDTEYADAEFDANRVSGFGGCNRYDALYRAGGRTLFISDPASTLMACVEPSMDFETAYLALLGQSRFYSARANTLTIFGADRRDPARVRRRAREPAARPLGRRLVRQRPGLGRRRPAGHGARRRVRDRQRGRVRRLQPVQRHVRHQRQRRPHRPAGHDAPRLPGRRDDPGDGLPRGAPGRRPDRGADRRRHPQDLNGSPNVFLVRPAEAAEGSPRRPRPRALRRRRSRPRSRPRSPRRSRPRSRRPSPTPKPTPKPTATPTTAPPPDVRARRRHVPAQHGRRRQGRQDHLPGELVHGDDPGGPRLPVLRPRADHGAGGPVDARDRGHGVVVGHDVRGCRGRRDGRDLVGRDGAAGRSR